MEFVSAAILLFIIMDPLGRPQETFVFLSDNPAPELRPRSLRSTDIGVGERFHTDTVHAPHALPAYRI